jgi:hypothetical protein
MPEGPPRSAFGRHRFEIRSMLGCETRLVGEKVFDVDRAEPLQSQIAERRLEMQPNDRRVRVVRSLCSSGRLDRWLDPFVEPLAHGPSVRLDIRSVFDVVEQIVQSILRKHTLAASRSCPSLLGKRVSPHVLRNSIAMELLHHGVDQSNGALARA